MKKRYVVALVLVLLELLTTAQERNLATRSRRGESSVLAVLLRERCDPRWLSQVLTDSGIARSEWDNLPLGREIRLRGPCRETPPPHVVKASKALMVSEPTRAPARLTTPRKTSPKRVRVQTPQPAPQSKPAAPNQQVGEAQSQAGERLAQANEVLRRVAEKEKDLIKRESKLERLLNEASARGVNSQRRSTVRTLLAISLVTLAVLVLLLLWLYRHLNMFAHTRRRYKIKHEGEKYEFVLDESNLPHYQCLKCKQLGTIGKLGDFHEHARICAAGRVAEKIDPTLAP